MIESPNTIYLYLVLNDCNKKKIIITWFVEYDRQEEKLDFKQFKFTSVIY